jgi:hypothetical protein
VIGGKIKFYNTVNQTWEDGTTRIPLDRQLSQGYDWVLELAEHKSVKFPGLESVTLYGNVLCPEGWKYPKDLIKAFEAASIQFVVEFRPDNFR